ncbi:hypothetical protein CC78DRAFT_564634 [Lojkania enalia]|uniref:Uncharacterized protein n=1 Tax=Lojkania enalia TaxID=147567 RepID=A0A9P4TQA6_9PLEO|nr:hypothetical protein CC78DRAFT_564634 [Didymosphaeria enalia]
MPLSGHISSNVICTPSSTSPSDMVVNQPLAKKLVEAVQRPFAYWESSNSPGYDASGGTRIDDGSNAFQSFDEGASGSFWSRAEHQSIIEDRWGINPVFTANHRNTYHQARSLDWVKNPTLYRSSYQVDSGFGTNLEPQLYYHKFEPTLDQDVPGKGIGPIFTGQRWLELGSATFSTVGEDWGSDTEAHNIPNPNPSPNYKEFAPKNLIVTYCVTVKASGESYEIPLDSEHIFGLPKDIVNGMETVWQWLLEKGLTDKVTLDDVYNLLVT